MRFGKLHGYGNDYLVFEEAELAGVASLGEFARRVCHRHFGAGGDGIAVVGRLEDDGAADFSLRIFNPDGGEAAMSGNGSRCAAAYLHYRGLWAEDVLRFRTRAGVKRYALRERMREGAFRFEAEIGRPLFDGASIPMLTRGALAEVRDYPLALPGGEIVRVTAMQMCNPNCVLFAEDLERIDWRRLGSLIEPHAQFPERTNVEFVRVLDRANIEARVWERGVGETLSSGTGACAAAIAAMVNGLADRSVNVSMPGGLLRVVWREDGEVLLTGIAEVVYEGVLRIDPDGFAAGI